MLEIYNEEYKDLLGKGPPPGATPILPSLLSAFPVPVGMIDSGPSEVHINIGGEGSSRKHTLVLQQTNESHLCLFWHPAL